MLFRQADGRVEKISKFSGSSPEAFSFLGAYLQTHFGQRLSDQSGIMFGCVVFSGTI